MWLRFEHQGGTKSLSLERHDLQEKVARHDELTYYNYRAMESLGYRVAEGCPPIVLSLSGATYGHFFNVFFVFLRESTKSRRCREWCRPKPLQV